MTSQSTKFLSNPEEFLADMVKNLNYDTCHAIKNYDATECAEDCKQLEMGVESAPPRGSPPKNWLWKIGLKMMLFLQRNLPVEYFVLPLEYLSNSHQGIS